MWDVPKVVTYTVGNKLEHSAVRGGAGQQGRGEGGIQTDRRGHKGNSLHFARSHFDIDSDHLI